MLLSRLNPVSNCGRVKFSLATANIRIFCGGTGVPKLFITAKSLSGRIASITSCPITNTLSPALVGKGKLVVFAV